MSQGVNSGKEAYLFIGVNPKRHSDIIATFTGKDIIPLSWYFLFSPEEVKIRREILPEQISKFDAGGDMDAFEQFAESPVAFKSSLPDAKARLTKYKNAFSGIPYLWSYFKVIELLDREIEDYIYQLETEPEQLVLQRQRAHPETKLSQVKIAEDPSSFDEALLASSTSNPSTSSSSASDDPFDFDPDNPFAGLEDFGAEIEAAAGPVEEKSAAEELESAFSDTDLLSALADAAALDFGDTGDDPGDLSLDDDMDEISFDATDIEDEDDDVMPIMIFFDEISGDGKGKRMAKIPLLLERLVHHAEREGEITRVMLDLLQEIFRDAQTGLRVTGQLSEDFLQSNPEQLNNIMLGEPSPYVIMDTNLDLEYWTSGTLQSGDERLMYSLTQLPSEQIHIAIQSGRLADISKNVGSLLTTTQSMRFPRLTIDLLKQPPNQSDIWGFRVLIRDDSGEFKPATLLVSDPNISWRKEFESNLKLPGVLEDWNIEIPVRFNEFTDIDKYHLVFEGAKDIDETFAGFVRWARRHHIMYRQQYGVDGTIRKLKQLLIDTTDKQLGQLIFDIMTNLTELGFDLAIDSLSDDAIVRKLPWLYS